MLKRARGLKSLVHDAVDFTVDLVEEGHESTARTVMWARRGPRAPLVELRNRERWVMATG